MTKTEIEVDQCEQHISRPMDLNHLNEVIAEISAKGLEKPILVRPQSKAKLKYKIIDGNYRHEAMKRLGKKTIPAWVL